PLDLGELGGGGALLALDGGLLLGGIDLHHGSAGGDLFAGVDEDLGNDAFDLRHDHGGVAGLQGGDVVGGVVDFLGLGGLDFDGHGLGLRRSGFGFIALAAGGGEQKRGEKPAGQNQKRCACDNSRHNSRHNSCS